MRRFSSLPNKLGFDATGTADAELLTPKERVEVGVGDPQGSGGYPVFKEEA
jgi:hypothetical protein